MVSETSVIGAVVAELAEMLKLPASEIGPASDLVHDLGVDSLTLTQLLVGVEQRLGVRLSAGAESQLAGVCTVAEFASRFHSGLQASGSAAPW